MKDYTQFTLGELLAVPSVARSAMSILKTLQRRDKILELDATLREQDNK